MTVKLTSIKADLTRELKGDWIDVQDWPGVALNVSSLLIPAYRIDRDLLGQRLSRQYKGKPIPPDVLTTEVGSLLKSHAKSLQREVPLHLATPAPQHASNDPMDQIMYRGRIDLLIPAQDGPVLIDYKIDAIPADEVRSRAAAHTPQLTAYRTALEKITGRPVQSYIVFLTPRVIHHLER